MQAEHPDYTAANRLLFQRYPKLFFVQGGKPEDHIAVKISKTSFGLPAFTSRKEAEAYIASSPIAGFEIAERSEVEFFALNPPAAPIVIGEMRGGKPSFVEPPTPSYSSLQRFVAVFFERILPDLLRRIFWR